MWPLKRNRRREVVPAAGHKEASRWFKSAGNHINGYLQRKTRTWTPSQLKAACLLFVLVAGGASLGVLINALHHPAGVMQITPIQAPPTANSPGSEPIPYDAQTQASVHRIKAFRRFLDSLRNDPEGHIWYDSLRQARPGLFDSIDRVERLYDSQKSNHFLNK